MARILLRKPQAQRESATVLLRVIQAEGLPTLTQLIKHHAGKAKEAPPLAQAFTISAKNKFRDLRKSVSAKGLVNTSKEELSQTLRQTKQFVTKISDLTTNWGRMLRDSQNHYQSLKAPAERLEYVLLLAIYSASYLSGLSLGYWVPTKDLALVKRSSPKTGLTFYAVSVFALRLSLDWLQSMLKKAAAHPTATGEDKALFLRMGTALGNLQEGTLVGLSVGELQRQLVPWFSKNSLSQEIVLKDDAFEFIESLVSTLVTQSESPQSSQK